MPMFSKYTADIPRVVKLYDSGLTFRQVAERVGIHHTVCARLYAKMGRKSRGGKAAPKIKHYGVWWFQRKDRYFERRKGDGARKARVFLHRYIWEMEVGPIPEGHDIHHIDFNNENNDLFNLQCLPHAEHEAVHGRTFRSLHGNRKKDPEEAPF